MASAAPSIFLSSGEKPTITPLLWKTTTEQVYSSGIDAAWVLTISLVGALRLSRVRFESGAGTLDLERSDND